MALIISSILMLKLSFNFLSRLNQQSSISLIVFAMTTSQPGEIYK